MSKEGQGEAAELGVRTRAEVTRDAPQDLCTSIAAALPHSSALLNRSGEPRTGVMAHLPPHLMGDLTYPLERRHQAQTGWYGVHTITPGQPQPAVRTRVWEFRPGVGVTMHPLTGKPALKGTPSGQDWTSPARSTHTRTAPQPVQGRSSPYPHMSGFQAQRVTQNNGKKLCRWVQK